MYKYIYTYVLHCKHYICIDSKSLLPAPGRRFVRLDREDHDALRWLGDLVMFWSSSWSWRAIYFPSTISYLMLGARFISVFFWNAYFFLLGEESIDSYWLTWLTTTLLDITFYVFFSTDLFCGMVSQIFLMASDKKDEMIETYLWKNKSYVGCGPLHSNSEMLGFRLGSPPKSCDGGDWTVQVGPPIPTRSLYLGLRKVRTAGWRTDMSWDVVDTHMKILW